MKSSLINMVLSLGIITVVAAAALAGVYSLTEKPIAQAELDKKIAAIAAVNPGLEFDNDPVADAVDITPQGEAEAVKVFPARKDGALVGAAVESYTTAGFSGRFTVIYGFDASGVVRGFEVMKHEETPGLGAKMGEWFAEGGRGNVVGLDPATANLTVSKDGGDVDAITAATITSRAFLDALHRAHTAFLQYQAQQ